MNYRFHIGAFNILLDIVKVLISILRFLSCGYIRNLGMKFAGWRVSLPPEYKE